MAEDWLDAAVSALAEGGLSAVAIEPLARQLGVTKGSFYHHFEGLDQLVVALCKHWESKGTDAVIAELETLTDPAERLRRLVHVAWAQLHELRAESALTAAAACGDRRVAPFARRVAEKRLAFVERIYRARGFAKGQARQRALHVLSTYLGTITLVGSGVLQTEAESRKYMRHVETTLLKE